ncbi:S-adenosyl-L-methionine-dependent methyltransferase [Canariomyces notabilis]|uniref:S-adenosyl-L-methionine-dependent methyltransferase n=1 Tax=Canariomyces notabilis TaxID=2074819 RepID=A0AAN6TKA3_9PEZI|nr:S-adenosyl-L-methionine-dependent methyltransferase [Canariomyces arenarius]
MAPIVTVDHGDTGRVNLNQVAPELTAAANAVEALKAVQEIVNSFLSNGTLLGQPLIPTPERSPVPKLEEFVEGDVDDIAEREQEQVVTGDEVNLAENVMSDGDMNGSESATAPTSITPACHRDLQPPTIEEPPAADPKTARLRQLSDQISRNISLISSPDTTDSDAASLRVKTATAAAELAGAVRPPPDVVMNLFATMSVVSAVRLFMHWRAFEAIPTGPGEQITYRELAKRIDAEEGLVTRVGNMLTSSSILSYHAPISSSPDESESPSISVSHTPTSLLLLPRSPFSAMFSLLYTNIVHTSTILPDYFTHYGRTEPIGPAHIPTSYLAGQPELDYFTVLRRDPAATQNFMRAMAVSHARVPVVGMYPSARVAEIIAMAERQGREVVWVDVGGGAGHVLSLWRKRYPGLGRREGWCVVQDLEEVVKVAEGKAKGDAARDGVANEMGLEGVRWMSMDFHSEPPVRGALIYYLRHILRDYSDPVATTILRNIALAMAGDADSRVLIAEQLNPDAGDGPLPLYAAFKDYSMLSVGGKERSREQFAAIADAAGLRVSGLYRDEEGGTLHAIVELALK